jgi:hypothetical protein
MNDKQSGGLPCSLWAAIRIIAAVLLAGAMGGILPDKSTSTAKPSTTTTTTNTETNTEVDILSDNTVRILSPDTYIYYNSGDTTTRVDGDRNNVAGQTGGGQCWVSSANAWGPCPAGAAAGIAVP